MIKKLVTIGAAGALLALSAVPAFAYPGEPDYNFAQLRDRERVCPIILWAFLEPVHDAEGNTYEDQGEACLSGGAVFWSGPAH